MKQENFWFRNSTMCVFNLIMLIVWTANFWFIPVSTAQILGPFFMLWHAYVFTDYYGKWADERRNKE